MPSGTGKVLPARRIARLLTMGRDHLCRADAVQVAQIEASLPALATARQLTDRFTDMVRNACEETLADWIDEAEDSMIASFACGLRSDYAAVAAALREPWSRADRGSDQSPEDAETPDVWPCGYRVAQGKAHRSIMIRGVPKLHRKCFRPKVGCRFTL